MSSELDFLDLKRRIMQDIYEKRMLLTSTRDRAEGWKLVSGLWSPFYIQLRLISSFPQTLRRVGRAMSVLLKNSAPDVTKLVGIAFAGIPIATAISLESNTPAVHTRKLTGIKTPGELKKALTEYGQHRLVEGVIEDGDVLCLIDDLVTGMESKLVARAQVMAEVEDRGLTNVKCDDIAVVIDRQQGARTRAESEGMSLHALIDFVDTGLPLIRDMMNEGEFDLIRSYLEAPNEFQKG
jgi:orotate phosphoribosyltransferase